MQLGLQHIQLLNRTLTLKPHVNKINYISSVYYILIKPLKKSTLILIFGLISINLNSQEIEFIFKFKEVKSNHYGLDSLVLYKNGTFFRKKRYHLHGIESYNEKGHWNIIADSLILNLENIKIVPESNNEWNDFKRTDKFLIKRKNIFPVFHGIRYRKKKLKLKNLGEHYK